MLQKSRKRLEFNENDWEITVGESETQPKYHRRLEAPRKVETPPPSKRPYASQCVGPPQSALEPSGTVRHGGSKSWPTLAVSAEREAPLAGQYKATSLQPRLIIKSITWQARRGPGLTLRSTGAPTAGHQARAGGTRYIFRLFADFSGIERSQA